MYGFSLWVWPSSALNPKEETYLAGEVFSEIRILNPIPALTLAETMLPELMI